MCPPTRPSHTRLSSKLKGAEIISSEGNYKKEERKKKSHNAVPNLVRSQWLAAAIQSHRGERWPREVGGRGGEREGALCSPAWWLAGSHQEVSDFGERAFPRGCDPETTQAPITTAASGGPPQRLNSWVEDSAQQWRDCPPHPHRRASRSRGRGQWPAKRSSVELGSK